MELVWINDGSDPLNTTLLKRYLDYFSKTTRFTRVIYEENDGNKGIGYTLTKGINMCSNELIIKMDSDDIMVPDRIHKQLQYMFDRTRIKEDLQYKKEKDQDAKENLVKNLIRYRHNSVTNQKAQNALKMLKKSTLSEANEITEEEMTR